MKQILSICLVLSLATGFISCSKDSETTATGPSTTSAAIAGNWELRKDIGGIGGGSTHEPGNGIIYKFTTSTFESLDSGTVIESGTYTIIKDRSEINQVVLDRIIFNNDYSSTKTFITVSGNKLTLMFDAVDGGAREYEKIN